MAAAKFDLNELERRMKGAVETLKKEFAGLRTGRASTHLLDPVVVNVYGQRMPLAQLATVSTPDAKTISVQVWDRGQVSAVEKAIREANLGLNPIIDGALITPQYTWIGLLAALLAGASPIGTLVAAVFFAALTSGGFAMERATQVPRELTAVLQAVLILFLAATTGVLRRRGKA